MPRLCTPPTLLRLRTAAASMLLLFAAFPAHACTVCDSGTGRQVRAGLFDGHFLHQFTLVVLPIPVLAALVLLIHFGLPLEVSEQS